MRAKASILGAAMVLAMAATAMADLTWEGNQWYSMGGGFYRFTWLQVTNPYDPEEVTYDYRITDVTFSFTAGASGAVEAVRLFLGNSDACLYQPNITVSIQTDDGNGNPTGTVVGTAWTGDIGAYGVPPANPNRVYTAGTYDFPVTTANIEKGTVYHVRMKCNNILGPSGEGGPDGGSDVDFRLYSSDGWAEPRDSAPATWQWDKYMTRSYDGLIDEQMYGRYFQALDSDPNWQTGWLTGASGLMPGTTHIDEEHKLEAPLFEMYAGVIEDPGAKSGYEAYSPIEGLSQGYRTGVAARTVNDQTYTGERLPFHLTVQTEKVKIFARKTMADDGTWYWVDPEDPNEGIYWDPMPSNPDAPLIVELRDAGDNFIAKATIDPSALPWNDETSGLAGGYAWAEAELTDDAGNPLSGPLALLDGTKLIVKTQGLTSGAYSVRVQQAGTGSVPTDATNTYRGDDAYEIQSNDGGTIWTPNANQDFLFALQMELPVIDGIATIPGDANLDRVVNIGDLSVLGTKYGSGPGMTWYDGDFSGDGYVNIGDLTILGVHYGEHLPEPATVGLLAFGTLALISRRKLRK